MNGDFDDEDEDDEWVRTDIPHDTANSLRLAAVALEQADNDKSWWKWVIVSAHMAAASALVGYLMASDGTGANRRGSGASGTIYPIHGQIPPSVVSRALVTSWIGQCVGHVVLGNRPTWPILKQISTA
jgi:hypothetical protein